MIKRETETGGHTETDRERQRPDRDTERDT